MATGVRIDPALLTAFATGVRNTRKESYDPMVTTFAAAGVPQFGTLDEVTALRNQYTTRRTGMSDAIAAVQTAYHNLASAADTISTLYANTEDQNQIDIAAVQQALAPVDAALNKLL